MQLKINKLILVLILNSSIFILNCYSQSWFVIDPATIAGTPDLSDLYFVSDNEGWITSSSHAEIYHTTDGGETFEVQTTQYPCNAIHMLDLNTGYSGGGSGVVYYSTDGGLNWPAIGGIGVTLVDISFPLTGDTGYACGQNGNIHSITSSGTSRMTSGVPDHLYSLSFPVNSNEGWVCGGSIILHYTGGAWIADQIRPPGGYDAIHFVDNNNGWAVGDNGIIIHTTDGQNWTAQTNPSANTLVDVFFLNTQEGWAVGSGGTIIHTANGGTTWTVEGAGLTSATLRGVQFTSTTNGYVVGNEKTLIKYGMPLATEDANGLPTEFSLSQNYPNPFNPSTTIEYTVPSVETGHALSLQLKVYDILGNEVATLINEEQPPGEYSVEFNIRTDFESVPTNGIYFYKLQVGNNVETKKMLLLK